MSVSMNSENANIHVSSQTVNTDSEKVFSRPVGGSGSSEEELFVFGYSCKLFRDDFAAKAIDRGQHLIPWNGDETLMIDRYDCRGHITDVISWDADILKKENRISELSENEKAVENLCDEERYYDLNSTRDNHEIEEEKRRIRSEIFPNSAVPYNYEEPAPSNSHVTSSDDFEPFYPSERLRLPYGMEIPETMKMNAVIAKTAAFVAKHGLQMEILLKTKQSSNPQFDFLKYDNYLNPYYKHLVSLIKNNLYCPGQENEKSNHSILCFNCYNSYGRIYCHPRRVLCDDMPKYVGRFNESAYQFFRNTLNLKEENKFNLIFNLSLKRCRLGVN